MINAAVGGLSSARGLSASRSLEVPVRATSPTDFVAGCEVMAVAGTATKAGFAPLAAYRGEFSPPLGTIASRVVGATILALLMVPTLFLNLNGQGGEPQCVRTSLDANMLLAL